jgi:hypothetical protein
MPARMSTIDKQRISAVRTLEAMGWVFRGEWIAPASVTTPATTEADAMHVLRVPRAADGATERLARRFTSSSSSAPERADRRGVRAPERNSPAAIAEVGSDQRSRPRAAGLPAAA